MILKRRNQLILRYLDCTASQDEVATLEDLLRSNEHVRLYLRDLAEQAVMIRDQGRARMMYQQHYANPWWRPGK